MSDDTNDVSAAPGPSPTGQATQPAPGYWLAPMPPRETDGLSIAALVLGIVPILAGLLGVIFGIIGIRRTAGGQRGGRGMAIAGLVCGSVWLVIFVAAIAVSASSSTHTQVARTSVPLPVPVGPGRVPIDRLRIGQCVADEPGGDTDVLPVVPCARPHEGEVYAIFSLGGSRYPGDDAVERVASKGCEQRLPAYVGSDAVDRVDWAYNDYTPTAETWTDGDRRVLCTLNRDDGRPLVGSQRSGVASSA